MGEPNPDDCIIEPCVVCEKPTVVFNRSIIFTKRGSRWTFDNYECFIKWSIEEGYMIGETV